MIATRSLDEPFRTLVTNGRFRIAADAPKLGLGGAGGLRPHELLEAALASCMNISVRLAAHELGVGTVAVRTVVQLDRSQPGLAAYRFRVRLDGPLTAAHRSALQAAARECVLGQTLHRTCSLLEDPSLELQP